MMVIKGLLGKPSEILLLKLSGFFTKANHHSEYKKLDLVLICSSGVVTFCLDEYFS